MFVYLKQEKKIFITISENIFDYTKRCFGKKRNRRIRRRRREKRREGICTLENTMNICGFDR